MPMHKGYILRDGFALAEERYGALFCCCLAMHGVHVVLMRRDGRIAEYKPILEEVERILAEAGLDEEEMRKGAAAGPHNPSGQSRNRR